MNPFRRILNRIRKPAATTLPESSPLSAIDTYFPMPTVNKPKTARKPSYRPSIVVQGVADRLGIKSWDVIRLIAVGKLPAEKVVAGNRMGFHVSPYDLQAFKKKYNADTLKHLIASLPRNPNINGRVSPTAA